MQETASNRNRIIITSVAVVIAIAIIGLSVIAANNQKVAEAQAQFDTGTQSNTTTSTTTTPDTTTPTTTPNTPATTPATSGFKDGTYQATGTYRSPGSNHERITITVTLKGGVITNTSAVSGAQEQEGRDYQSLFIDSYKQLVVGKSIDNVSLSRVSGSSLTSQGFNDAINQIEQQAKA